VGLGRTPTIIVRLHQTRSGRVVRFGVRFLFASVPQTGEDPSNGPPCGSHFVFLFRDCFGLVRDALGSLNSQIACLGIGSNPLRGEASDSCSKQYHRAKPSLLNTEVTGGN
jgi:hypothetical protein